MRNTHGFHILYPVNTYQNVSYMVIWNILASCNSCTRRLSLQYNVTIVHCGEVIALINTKHHLHFTVGLHLSRESQSKKSRIKEHTMSWDQKPLNHMALGTKTVYVFAPMLLYIKLQKKNVFPIIKILVHQKNLKPMIKNIITAPHQWFVDQFLTSAIALYWR
jgi:hypothetical protein